MAIQVNGTEVISNSRALNNIASVDATTVSAFEAAGVGAASAGSLGGSITATFQNPEQINGQSNNSMDANTDRSMFFGTTEDTCFICTYRNVYRSTNAGASFTKVFNWDGSNNSQMVYHKNYNPCAWDNNGNIMFVTGDYYGGLVRSTNGGANWSISNPSGQTIGNIWAPFALGDGYFVYTGGDSVTKRSSDAGASWSTVTSGDPAPRSGFTSNSGTTVFVGQGNKAIYRSTNLKTAWSPSKRTIDGYVQASEVSVTTNNSGTWVLGDGKYSTDDGLTWNTGTNSAWRENLSYTNGYWYFFDGNYYAYTNNPANAWTYVYTGLGTSNYSEQLGYYGRSTAGVKVTSPSKQLGLAYHTGNRATMAVVAMDFS